MGVLIGVLGTISTTALTLGALAIRVQFNSAKALTKPTGFDKLKGV